ncbi:gliding motility-associated C-terminal domain-containing protein [Chryseobacterium sp. HSC-36S06]|uniref:T9SS type B sorting domain-containing protein n=1 Tax=Chryseobacterium sp. HSC-36S06 TaxID=2910970 RepID=UPI00209D9D40|nr:gliding motility-associated C-terminal domain-containing protein [Chryseobacterium sp. HSC-36S06]MCP2039424.1 gliding motility-associated-like protein [Chryseobacterium sp. HSC-36S06]
MAKNLSFLLIHFFCLSIGQMLYKVCDTDFDGKYTFTETDKKNILNLYKTQQDEEASVYITSFKSGILKIKNVESTDPTLEYICRSADEFPYFYEIAVNSNNELYITTEGGKLFKIDEQNCNKTLIADLLNDVQALSFDNHDNLYLSYTNSIVRRASADNLTIFEEWHDFNDGFPSGDFVMVGNKMYISWVFSIFGGPNYLYEITVDDQNNYISHKNLGLIKNDTWGLASEYGKLYGVTKSELYEINLGDLSTKTIMLNPKTDPSSQWWGAAGKHEAQNIVMNLFENAQYASDDVNAITFNYENSNPFSQTIYLRVDNLTLGSYEIYPILLKINSPPALDPQNEYTLCYNGDLGTVTIDSNLSADDHIFTWQKVNGELMGTNDKLIAQSAGLYKVIVQHKISGCISEKTFSVRQSDIAISDIVMTQDNIFISATGTDQPFTYSFDNITQASPNYNEFGFGDISMYATNSKGCVSKKVSRNISISNAISPNGDRTNEGFHLKYPTFKKFSYEISIINKMGEQVYRSKVDQHFKWDGKSISGRPLPSDTYWYTLVSTENSKIYRGYIYLKNH